MIRKYPAVFILLFVLVGILLADQTRWSAELFLLVAVVLCLAGFALFRTSPRVAAPLFGLFMLAFSAYQFSIRYYDTGPNHLSKLVADGERYQVFGRVVDWPDIKSSGTEIKIAVDSLGPPVERAAQGAILLKVSDSVTALQRGDRVEFRSRIHHIKGGKSPGGFDYRRYLQMKGVFGVVYMTNLLSVRLDTGGRSVVLGWIDGLRSAITSSFHRNLTEAAASLASGFLIGETRNIDPEVYQMFRDSGTLHLLAVSGSNVALVLAFAVLLLRPLALRRQLRAILLLATTLVFALLSYGEPSVVRASIMASLVIGAGLVHRRYDLNNIVATAALIILLVDPAQLFDVGFQLSFVVAWGLIYIMPKIHQRFDGYHGRKWYRWLVFPALFSLVAQVCASPLIAIYFQRIPLISPLANLVIIPLVSLAVVASLGLLLADLILPLLGVLVGSLLSLHFSLILKLLAIFGGDEVSVWEVSRPSWFVAAAVYLFLIVGALAMWKRRWRRVLVFVVLASINVALLTGLKSPEAGDSLHLFGVPGGVCGVLTRPDGATADMIITGLRDRTYPVDERILKPALVAMKLQRLNNLIILSAEYGALDDILRLANDFSAGRLYLHADREAALADVAAVEGLGLDSSKTQFFTGDEISADPGEDGWRVYDDGAELAVGGERIAFIDYPDPDLLAGMRSRPPEVIVIGRWVYAADRIYELLRQAGTRHLVAAGVQQRRPPDKQDDNSPIFSQAGDYLIDLSRLGGIQLLLQSEPSQAFLVVSQP